jgi:hypothetical protein
MCRADTDELVEPEIFTNPWQLQNKLAKLGYN